MKIVIAAILCYVAFNDRLFVKTDNENNDSKEQLIPDGLFVKTDNENNDSKEQLVSDDEDAADQSSLDHPPVPSGGGICLSTHNALRALHRRTPDLIWDPYLAAEAQKWANHLASISKSKHATPKQRPDQGENLAHTQIPPGNKYHPLTCEEAINMWYMEIDNYNWRIPGKSKNGKPIGHFTQIVWKKTKMVGMGIAVVNKNRWTYTYVVARYSPAANMRGQYGKNVMTLKSVASPCDSNPCQNQGVCFSQVISYSCECSSVMYTGKNCETKRACKDTFGTGGCRLNKKNFCSGKQAYHKYLIQCLATCEECTPASQCIDTKSFCASYKKKICNDYQYRSYKKFCKRTCGTC